MAQQKIGRNALCPCGSGRKFRHCCLPKVPTPRGDPHVERSPWVASIGDAARRAGAAPGVAVPSVIWKGHRFRAVGTRVYWRPPQETFHEFIVELVKQTFGKEWHGAQVASAPGDRHQLMTWFDGLSEVIRRGRLDSRSEVEDGVWSSVPTGDAWALVTFAYDIFHLLHHLQLPDELVERLRHEDQFQGARYEVAVAAVFVRARFEVKFTKPEGVRKRCDFIARDHSTGIRVAVEAKSRHRPGVLGQPGEVHEARALRGDVEGLVNDALAQNPGGIPFIVFVDVNVPPVPGIPILERAWFRDVWDLIGSMAKPGPDRPDDVNAFIFTNFSYHWDGAKPSGGAEYVHVISQFPKHPLSAELIGRVLAAVRECGNVPREV